MSYSSSKSVINVALQAINIYVVAYMVIEAGPYLMKHGSLVTTVGYFKLHDVKWNCPNRRQRCGDSNSIIRHLQ
ncbi:hypothetical protein QBC47DRAFT_407899 [Echria macrotheca]|uniref:Uncharacterized protein n=1 Tax=Echria macrotheca TaxID=438768 RepID=A0AAJ0B0Q0_9PEZI|nr:hypothetical protein QBC47DRAFT_407899 [Echria macrotheca]